MASPGVSTCPIKLISGKSPFSELFFDNVKVPKENLVGELNDGWTIAKYLLTHEREMIADMGTQAVSLSDSAIKEIGLNDRGVLADPILRTDIARHAIDDHAFAITLERASDEAQTGQGMGAVSSVFKYFGTELNMKHHELLLSIYGNQGLGWEGKAYNDGAIPRDWLRTKGNAIEGGTSEIQLNIIAKHVLDLPSA